MNKKSFLIAFIVAFFLSANAYSQSTKNNSPQPYSQEEFPQALQDLRRFEIITLGSMPFVTMDAAIVYNGYKYFSGKADKFNPLATADYKPEEMKKIIISSLCISAGIGLSDYIIRLIKRKSSQKKDQEQTNTISISENPEAVKIDLPEDIGAEE